MQSLPKNIYTDKSFLFRLVLIITIALCLFVTLAIAWPRFSRAEIFFAECAREMLIRSNFTTPLYHDKPFFDKPILVYWLIVTSFKLFGISHLAARIPSILAALASIFTVAISGYLIATAETGLIAAMALASSFMFFSFAALCMSDMLLTAFDSATLFFLYIGIITENKRTKFWSLAALSMGLAFLTKGPVGCVLPIITFVLYLLATKQIQIIKTKHIFLFALIIIVIASPWFFAALQKNGIWAMNYFFLRENLERFAGKTYDSHRPIWFMLVSLFSGFAPWSVFLPIILVKSFNKWKQNLQGKLELYLWLWIAVVILFFSASHGKIDYYALPAYPACALLVGMYISFWMKKQKAISAAFGYMASLFFLTCAFIASMFLQKFGLQHQTNQLFLLPIVLAIPGIMIAVSLRDQRQMRAYFVIYIGICFSVITFCYQNLPNLIAQQPMFEYMARIKRMPTNVKIGMEKTMDSWIDEATFSTAREPLKLSSKEEILDFTNTNKPFLLVIPKSVFKKIETSLTDNVYILDCSPFISHSLNPGYIFKSNGKLVDNDLLLLISNRQKLSSSGANINEQR